MADRHRPAGSEPDRRTATAGQGFRIDHHGVAAPLAMGGDRDPADDENGPAAILREAVQRLEQDDRATIGRRACTAQCVALQRHPRGRFAAPLCFQKHPHRKSAAPPGR